VVAITANEPPIDDIRDRQIRFDINCKARDGERVNKVERVGEKPVPEMTTQEHWAYVFRYLTDKRKRDKINEVIANEEGIAMASEVLISISRDGAGAARERIQIRGRHPEQGCAG
jgi:hypothetical protein